jgi:hypothetical protein
MIHPKKLGNLQKSSKFPWGPKLQALTERCSREQSQLTSADSKSRKQKKKKKHGALKYNWLLQLLRLGEKYRVCACWWKEQVKTCAAAFFSLERREAENWKSSTLTIYNMQYHAFLPFSATVLLFTANKWNVWIWMSDFKLTVIPSACFGFSFQE